MDPDVKYLIQFFCRWEIATGSQQERGQLGLAVQMCKQSNLNYCQVGKKCVSCCQDEYWQERIWEVIGGVKKIEECCQSKQQLPVKLKSEHDNSWYNKRPVTTAVAPRQQSIMKNGNTLSVVAVAVALYTSCKNSSNTY